MSNFRAIATVTRLLEGLLAAAASEAVSGSITRLSRPGDAEVAASPAINIFLHRVEINPALRNMDQPARRSDGSVAQAPRVPVSLDYLLTFYDTDDEPVAGQLMLARCLTALTAQPLFTGDYIRSAVDALTSTGRYPELVGSDLADQFERVQLSIVPLGLDELSKLWSSFFQTPYTLSILVRVSVVVLDTTLAPRPVLPVRAPQLFVVPKRVPSVDRVESADGATAPILAGGSIVVYGTGLASTGARVRLGDAAVTPSEVRDTTIRASLSDPSVLRAGIQSLVVEHPVVADTGEALAFAFSSNAVTVVLRPTLTVPADATATAGVLALDVTPSIAVGQRVVVILTPSGGGTSYSIDLGASAAASSRVEASTSGVAAGTYLVRVRVDDAESPLSAADSTDPLSAWAGPTVVIP